MPRPPKHRWVSFFPTVTYFKPAGTALHTLDEVFLQLDELEALRLKDLQGLDQVDCAREMGVSQSTLQRVLTAARAKVTEALVLGKAIRIEGGRVIGSGRLPASAAGGPGPAAGRGRDGGEPGHGRGYGHTRRGPPGPAAPGPGGPGRRRAPGPHYGRRGYTHSPGDARENGPVEEQTLEPETPERERPDR